VSSVVVTFEAKLVVNLVSPRLDYKDFCLGMPVPSDQHTSVLVYMLRIIESSSVSVWWERQGKECRGAGVCGTHEVPGPVENTGWKTYQ